MRALVRPLICYFVCVFLSGCVGLNSRNAQNITVDKQKIEFISSKQINFLISGTTIKDDVRKILGNTRSIKFESGYEIWVYQAKTETSKSVGWVEWIEHYGSGRGTLGNDEIVILFNPFGVVEKWRVRSL